MKTKLRKQYVNTCGKNPADQFCEYCLEKEDVISQLREQLKSVKLALSRQSKNKVTQKEVNSAAHVPPSRKYKSNSSLENRQKKGGATAGHIGNGRKRALNIEEKIEVALPKDCPCCKITLSPKDIKDRTLVEVDPIKARRISYGLKRGQCPKCKKIYQASLSCFPKALYGNRLLAQAAVMHYVYGMPMGRLLKVFGPEVSEGGLFQAFHRIGKLFLNSKEGLLAEFRSSEAKHADETGWRTDGASGYAWLFATDRMSWFEFRDTRASRVAKEIFGDRPVPGVLVVDRYNGYNRLPVNIQYCFAHLLREVEKVEKEFPDSKEASWFVEKMSKALGQAMKLRGKKLGEEDYLFQAKEIKNRIELEVSYAYQHQAIKRIQNIFKDKAERMYHWANDSRVPAENNLAERELRPTVISRKTSFGSQSEEGAKTRGAIMSFLFTAKKRLEKYPLEEWLLKVLNDLSKDPELDVYGILPP